MIRQKKRTNVGKMTATAGASVATASYVIHGKNHPNSKPTAGQVKHSTQNLKTKPAAMSGDLARPHTFNIGLYIGTSPEALHSWNLTALLTQLNEVAAALGMTLRILHKHHIASAEKIREHGLDGILCLGHPDAIPDKVPKVCLGLQLNQLSRQAERKTGELHLDAAPALREGVAEWIEHGVRRIGWIQGPKTPGKLTSLWKKLSAIAIDQGVEIRESVSQTISRTHTGLAQELAHLCEMHPGIGGWLLPDGRHALAAVILRARRPDIRWMVLDTGWGEQLPGLEVDRLRMPWKKLATEALGLLQTKLTQASCPAELTKRNVPLEWTSQCLEPSLPAPPLPQALSVLI